MDLLSLEEAQGLPSKVRTTEYSSWGRRCPSTLSSKVRDLWHVCDARTGHYAGFLAWTAVELGVRAI